jgi:hypothetical protein
MKIASNRDRPTPSPALQTMILGALGIVFGDIGTSQLYTLKTVLALSGGKLDPMVVLGILSLLIWTLVLITTIKYVTVAMRIDNDGEGAFPRHELDTSLSLNTSDGGYPNRSPDLILNQCSKSPEFHIRCRMKDRALHLSFFGHLHFYAHLALALPFEMQPDARIIGPHLQQGPKLLVHIGTTMFQIIICLEVCV